MHINQKWGLFPFNMPWCYSCMKFVVLTCSLFKLLLTNVKSPLPVDVTQILTLLLKFPNTNKQLWEWFSYFGRNHMFSVPMCIIIIWVWWLTHVLCSQKPCVFFWFLWRQHSKKGKTNCEFSCVSFSHFFRKSPHFLPVVVPLNCLLFIKNLYKLIAFIKKNMDYGILRKNDQKWQNYCLSKDAVLPR